MIPPPPIECYPANALEDLIAREHITTAACIPGGAGGGPF